MVEGENRKKKLQVRKKKGKERKKNLEHSPSSGDIEKELRRVLLFVNLLNSDTIKRDFAPQIVAPIFKKGKEREKKEEKKEGISKE